MRIAHIITRMIIGGAQENTLLNCQDLVRIHGDEVLLITGPSPGPEGSLMDRIGDDVPLRLVPSLIRSIRPWSDLGAYGELRKILREFKPEIVHTHSAKAGILGRAAAYSLKVPAIVHTVHGAPFHQYQNFIVRESYRRCERWAAKRTDAIIGVADAMCDMMILSNVAPREKFRTIYSGMETKPFLESAALRKTTRERLGFDDRHVVIGKIARLFHLKGHDDVIDAAVNIVRKNQDVRFLFVGDGILNARLKDRISALGMEKFFVFTGLVPPEVVPEMISAMDVVVHASLREGLARVLPQALLSGKPAVSYDIDGAREVVIDGETGRLIPARSIELLGETILELAADPDLRNKMGQEGRKRFAERFEHEYMTREIRKLYIETLAGTDRSK